MTMALYKYPMDEWKQALATQPFVQLLSTVERDRCAADLMYTLLLHPEQQIGATGGTIIQRLVSAGFDIILKKYAPDIQQSRMIREARAYIVDSGLADTYVQRFVFLFMLHKEEELQELVEQAYVEGGKHLWGTNAEARAHFRRFLIQLAVMVQSTLDWPCSELNILDVVRNMVRAAAKCYLTKF